MAKFNKANSKKKFHNRAPQSPKPQHSLELIPKETQEKYLKQIEELYNTTFRIKPKQLFINSKDKIYFSTINEIPTNLTRVNALGLYLGTLVNSGHIRLSIEGSQLLNEAKENFVILKKEYLASYLAGENLFFDEIKEEHISEEKKAPFVIIYDENKENALGTISKKKKNF